MRAALALAALLLTACPGDRPLERSLIEQAEEREAVERRQGSESSSATRDRSARGYVKREGLHIDLPYLGGRRLQELGEAVIADQLGVELRREELPESEEHVEFDKADVWLYDGRIYRIRKELAHPMDVATALGTSGFPLSLGSPIESSSELRWNTAWNQRRVKLLKTKADPRLYDVIDVTRFLPKELY